MKLKHGEEAICMEEGTRFLAVKWVTNMEREKTKYFQLEMEVSAGIDGFQFTEIQRYHGMYVCMYVV